MSDFCDTLKGSVIKLGNSNKKETVALLKLKRETYKSNLDCYITVQAPENCGIIAFVKKVKLRKSNISHDILEISADDKNATMIKWYGTNQEIFPKVNIITKSNSGFINVKFRTGDFVVSLPNKGFKIVLTTFTSKLFSMII